MASVSGAALLGLAPLAHAQGGAPAAGPQDAQAAAAASATPGSASAGIGLEGAGENAVGEIVVTASRLTASGFTAPTPTTVIGATDIANNAQPSIFTTVTQLPSLQGSTGPTTGQGGTSGGTNGLSSFNMRGLGTIRTLTLLDGQRVVPANVTGVPDVSQFPQLLVQRVDVVTGGASASYGSDAVAGVINFITDKKFQGFKFNVLGGVTTYGDNESITAQGAAGTAFAGGRGHIEVSGEYSREDGVPSNGFGEGEGPNGRDWYQAPQLQIRTIAGTPAGQPQITNILHGQDYQFAKYGLITSGPLQGIAFGPGGQPFPFQYGSNGTPTGTGAVTNCVNPFCFGGDNSGAVGNGSSLASMLERRVAYGRISYDLTPTTEIFATVNLARVDSSNTPNPGAFKNANLTIQCANPFVPASIQAACAQRGITSFQFGTANAEFPEFISVNPRRDQQRFVVGADGTFGMFGKEWSFDTYYQHGRNHTLIHVDDITLTPRYNAAIDAIAGPNGTVICRSPAAQASGCVPLNVIGDVPVSEATWRYIAPEHGPIQDTHQQEDAFSFTLNGQPINLWAGPVAFAAGFEYRNEEYNVRGDPYGNGVTADTPNTADYPADPVLNATLGNNWYAGNFHNGAGSFHVWEVFGELGIPLWNNESMGKFDLNLAGRATDYSTSGRVNTWKIGGTYDTPIQGVRLRAVRSRDVRAPNLSELFAAPIVTNGTVINPQGLSVTILNQALGNPDLKPEIGSTSEVGFVLQRPNWLPGFSASIDYYKIKLQGQIASLTAQQIVDLCAAGTTSLCSNINLTGTATNPNYVQVRQFNLASTETDGVDIEASFRFGLARINMPGAVTLRGLATYVHDFTQVTGVPGTVPVQRAGENSGAIPKWKVLATQSWSSDRVSLTLTERYFPNGVLNSTYIQCTSSCPAPTVAHPTIDNNVVKGRLYIDVGGTFNITSKLVAYAKVDNLTNRPPAPIANSVPNNAGTNPALYDTLGRTYRVGLRGSF